MAKSFCPTLGESLPCIRKQSIASAATAAASSASGRRSIPRCLGNSPPAIPQQAANRARYRSRHLRPSRRGRARSRDRQQRNQGGRRRLAVPRAEGLGCRMGDASRSQGTCASRALSALLPVAAARFGGIRPRRPAVHSRAAERRHGGYRCSPRNAGLAITIFPEFNLPNSLKALGAAEALPALPDFEFVLRRSRTARSRRIISPR